MRNRPAHVFCFGRDVESLTRRLFLLCTCVGGFCSIMICAGLFRRAFGSTPAFYPLTACVVVVIMALSAAAVWNLVLFLEAAGDLAERIGEKPDRYVLAAVVGFPCLLYGCFWVRGEIARKVERFCGMRDGSKRDGSKGAGGW